MLMVEGLIHLMFLMLDVLMLVGALVVFFSWTTRNRKKCEPQEVTVRLEKKNK